MSLAWAPVAIILLLLPGIFFFIGLASYERLSREIVRSGVVSEIAMATSIAIGIHTVALILLSLSGFRLSRFLGPLAVYSTTESLSPAAAAVLIEYVFRNLLPTILYLAVCTAIGFGLGFVVAIGVVTGPLRRLASHKWIYDIIDADRRGGIVTAFVMTTLKEESQVLMYKGRVHDLFLGEGGKISYIILKNCARYSMRFKDGDLLTTQQLDLFGKKQGDRPTHVWDRLMIDGSNIANVLFDSSAEIKGQAKAADRLEAEFRAALQRRQQASERARAVLEATNVRLRDLHQQEKS